MILRVIAGLDPLLSGLNSRAALMTRVLLLFPYFPVSETLKSFKR